MNVKTPRRKPPRRETSRGRAGQGTRRRDPQPAGEVPRPEPAKNWAELLHPSRPVAERMSLLRGVLSGGNKVAMREVIEAARKMPPEAFHQELLKLNELLHAIAVKGGVRKEVLRNRKNKRAERQRSRRPRKPKLQPIIDLTLQAIKEWRIPEGGIKRLKAAMRRAHQRNKRGVVKQTFRVMLRQGYLEIKILPDGRVSVRRYTQKR